MQTSSPTNFENQFSPQLGFMALSRGRLKAGERTKFKIARALEELTLSKSYPSVNVIEIADTAEISRQTFYNHFVDKADLVSWVYDQLDVYTISRIGIDLNWEEAVRTKLQFMKSKEPFFCELYKAEAAGKLINHSVDTVYQYYEANLKRMAGLSLSEISKLELRQFCYGSTGLVSEWARTGMSAPVDEVVRVERSALPAFAKSVFLGEADSGYRY